jgi:hypothetical protein
MENLVLSKIYFNPKIRKNNDEMIFKVKLLIIIKFKYLIFEFIMIFTIFRHSMDKNITGELNLILIKIRIRKILLKKNPSKSSIK